MRVLASWSMHQHHQAQHALGLHLRLLCQHTQHERRSDPGYRPRCCRHGARWFCNLSPGPQVVQVFPIAPAVLVEQRFWPETVLVIWLIELFIRLEHFQQMVTICFHRDSVLDRKSISDAEQRRAGKEDGGCAEEGEEEAEKGSRQRTYDTLIC